MLSRFKPQAIRLQSPNSYPLFHNDNNDDGIRTNIVGFPCYTLCWRPCVNSPLDWSSIDSSITWMLFSKASALVLKNETRPVPLTTATIPLSVWSSSRAWSIQGWKWVLQKAHFYSLKFCLLPEAFQVSFIDSIQKEACQCLAPVLWCP